MTFSTKIQSEKWNIIFSVFFSLLLAIFCCFFSFSFFCDSFRLYLDRLVRRCVIVVVGFVIGRIWLAALALCKWRGTDTSQSESNQEQAKNLLFFQSQWKNLDFVFEREEGTLKNRWCSECRNRNSCHRLTILNLGIDPSIDLQNAWNELRHFPGIRLVGLVGLLTRCFGWSTALIRQASVQRQANSVPNV